MSDILPVRMQDFLHSRKPDLRTEEIRKTEKRTVMGAADKTAALCVCSEEE